MTIQNFDRKLQYSSFYACAVQSGQEQRRMTGAMSCGLAVATFSSTIYRKISHSCCIGSLCFSWM